MGRLGPRFALEALFLILVAVGLAIADVRPLVIVLVMAGAWLLVSLLELIASRQPRFAPLVDPLEVVTSAPEPAAVPAPEPAELVGVDTEPGVAVDEEEIAEPAAVAPANGSVVAEREEQLIEVPATPGTAQAGAEVAPLEGGPAPTQEPSRRRWPFGRRRREELDELDPASEPQAEEVAEDGAGEQGTEDGSGAQGGTLEGQEPVESVAAEGTAPSVSSGDEDER